MKFYVCKTSPDGDNPPCEGAVRDGRDEKYDVQLWSIDLKDLDDLIEFARRQDHLLVLSVTPNFGPGPELEIVNDYRE